MKDRLARVAKVLDTAAARAKETEEEKEKDAAADNGEGGSAASSSDKPPSPSPSPVAAVTADPPLTPSEEAAVSKLFYHAFHKLFDLLRVARFGEPRVYLAAGSPERAFVMRVRRCPLVGDLAPSALMAKARFGRDPFRSVYVPFPSRCPIVWHFCSCGVRACVHTCDTSSPSVA